MFHLGKHTFPFTAKSHNCSIINQCMSILYTRNVFASVLNFALLNIMTLLQVYGPSHLSSGSAEGREVGGCDLLRP